MKKLFFIILLISLYYAQSISQYLWRPVSSGTTENLNRIFQNSAVGDNGTYIINNNGVWSSVNLGYTNNFNDKNSQYIVGDNGLILKLTAGWIQVQSGTTNDLNSVSMYGPRVYIVGDNGVLIRTTNSGQNWMTQNISAKNLKCVFSGLLNAVAAGDGGVILKSTNSGVNWVNLSSNTLNNINYIRCHGTNLDTILICGNNGLLALTTNSGASWQNLITGYNFNFTSFYYYTNYLNGFWNELWLTADNGHLLHTTNRGITWNVDHVASNPLNCIYDKYAVGNNGLMLFKDIYYYNIKYIDCNTISAAFSNNGGFNFKPVTLQNGFEWPKGSGKTARYYSGLWLGAKVDNDTLIANAHYGGEFSPGYTDNNGNYTGKNDTNYRIYRIDHGINNWDRNKWPNLVLGNSNQGAPVYFDSINSIWKPLDYGSQTMFMRFTDTDSAVHLSGSGGTKPLKADVTMINFANAGSGPLSNVILTEYKIINRSNKVWNNVYIAVWTDDDIGEVSDEKAGTDTSLALGYQYNADNYDNVYGYAPPAVGNMLLKGAVVYTGNLNDTVFYCDGKQRKYKVGYRDLGMTVFNAGENDTGYDPSNYVQTYRMLGGSLKDGTFRINPITNQPSKIVYTGDPVLNTGWIPTQIDEWRYHQSTGPINMNPGDTQTLVLAQIIARGTSNLNSITVLRQYAQEVRDYYNSCYTSVPIGIEPISKNIPDEFELYQNYPNPFNPKTIINFQLSMFNKVMIKVYDVTGKEVETLVNEDLQPGKYEAEFDGTNYASGLYFYSLIVDNSIIDTRKMVMIK